MILNWGNNPVACGPPRDGGSVRNRQITKQSQITPALAGPCFPLEYLRYWPQMA